MAAVHENIAFVYQLMLERKFGGNLHYEVLGEKLVHFKNDIKPTGFDDHKRCNCIVFHIRDSMDRWNRFDILVVQVAVRVSILPYLQVAAKAAVGRHEA